MAMSCCSKTAVANPTISLAGLGKVVGKVSKTRGNYPINIFKGIPYAKPPIGKLRFALPQSPDPWTDILDCSKKESKKCIQSFLAKPESNLLIHGSEDCLYLNVYTRCLPTSFDEDANPHPKLPVIVWFHGGAFCVGSNVSTMYGPDYLLDNEVILVGVNYRLGPLGFLSLECDEAPG